MPGRGRQSAALNRMSLPGEPAGRGRKAGRHRMCHPRRSVRQRNEVKEPRSGARTASPCPAPDCVITCRLTDWHYEASRPFLMPDRQRHQTNDHQSAQRAGQHKLPPHPLAAPDKLIVVMIKIALCPDVSDQSHLLARLTMRGEKPRPIDILIQQRITTA